MRVIFFWKCSNINVNSKNAQKNWENICRFWGKCIWICSVKFSLLRREYFSSSVSFLTNSLEILHIPKRDFYQLSYVHSDQSILQRCSRWDWNSVSTRLPCCPSRGPLEQDFLDIYLTTSLRVCNFGTT